MDVEFRNAALERYETERGARSDLPHTLHAAYRKRLRAIRAARDIRDLYQIKSNHFEKLAGDRAHQRSLRLNDQWRLVIELKERDGAPVVWVHDVEDYH
jgi:proteic killer suppression protein